MSPKAILLLCIALSLSACGKNPASYRSETLETHLQNPLFAEQYFEALVQRMVDMIIAQDPVLEDESTKTTVDDIRREGLEKTKQATQIQLKGTFGEWIAASEWATGEVLFVNDTIYFGPEFRSDPGPSLHVFITTLVDPRLESFPDESALDLGQIQSIFGDQSYVVKNTDRPSSYRTVVLFDTVLKRIYAFVQLSPF